MSLLLNELQELESKATEAHGRCDTLANHTTIRQIINEAQKYAAAHCGISLGSSSGLYRRELRRMTQFDLLNIDPNDRERWVTLTYEDVESRIFGIVGDDAVEALLNSYYDAGLQVPTFRTNLQDILAACCASYDYAFLRDRLKDTNGVKFSFYNDSQVPHHFKLANRMTAIQESFKALKELAELARRSREFLARLPGQQNKATKPVGTRVFIGHGHSPAWQQLALHLLNEHKLEYDEFNREPVAGYTNAERLSIMLDNAAFALLIMTAEDETKEGKMQARMNVIHEVGLFQGRLGFKRAIVLLENGCDPFSNIHGLSHIPFEPGKIKGAFGEVDATLRREGIIKQG